MTILSFLAAVLLHECGHLFALSLFHAQIKEARLSPFGITLTHSPLPTPLAAFTVAACGPLFGLLGYFAALSSGVFPLFSAISLLLSLFNLLPIRTLDGARMACSLLSLFLPPHEAEAAARMLSGFTLALLWLIGAYLLLWQDGSPSLFLTSLALFLEGLKNEG